MNNTLGRLVDWIHGLEHSFTLPAKKLLVYLSVCHLGEAIM